MTTAACAAQQPSAPGAASLRAKAICRYAIRGDLRHLAHHDQLRMLIRALRRAAWPLAYSKGFNPQPRITIPLPRNIGVASEAELALVHLDASAPLEMLYTALAAQMPADAPLLVVIGANELDTPQAQSAIYDLTLDDADCVDLETRIAALRAAPEIWINRDMGPEKPPRRLNIRPFITALDVAAGVLRMTTAIDRQQTARPDELLEQLKLPPAVYAYRVRRRSITWNIEFAGREQWPAQPVRNSVGQQDHNQEDHA